MTTTLLLVDGLRPDALSEATSPSIYRLMRRSAFSLSATSVMPSITLPCHMSIFHSVPPSRHGILTNQYQPMARPLPGLVEQIHAAGKSCHFFFNWEPLRDLGRPEKLSFAYFRDSAQAVEGDLEIASVAATTLAAEQPDFAFVYLGTVDSAGHDYGWMSSEYMAQVARADRGVGLLLDTLAETDTVLLQSDHGGHGRSHGTDLAEDMTIPWMIAGPGICSGTELELPVSLLDTAPTLAYVIGASIHAQWEGRCVSEAFVDQQPCPREGS